MPILPTPVEGALTTKESELELVWSYDPSVQAPKGLEDSGWFPRALAKSVAHDADVVTVRALEDEEFARVRDIPGKHQQLLAVCKASVVAANGSRMQSKVSDWIGGYSVRLPVVIDLLGNIIEAITTGVGAERHARNVDARIKAKRGGEAAPPPVKSPGPAKARKSRGARR